MKFSHAIAHRVCPALAKTACGVSVQGGFWPYPEMLGKRVAICAPGRVSRITLPMVGPRLAQYMALPSISERQVLDPLQKVVARSFE